MTKLVIALALALASASNALSKPPQPQPQAQTPSLEESVVDFYVGEFQRVVNVNPELFVKTSPIIKDFIRARFDISARRQETLKQLRMLVNRGGSEEDIKRAIRDLDKADADIHANQEHFLTSIDPLLNTRQQGRVRIFQQVADQAMRQMLNRVQNGRSANK
jgi:hypothetical protein